MQISVRTFEGKSIALDIQPNDTVRNVKKKIQSKERIRTELQRLMFGEKQLKNSKLLSSYGIGDNAVLHLILRSAQNNRTVAGGYGSGNGLDEFCYPYGLVIDEDQTIIIADWGNHRILQWKIDEKNGQIIAGGHEQGDQLNQLSNPTDLLLDKETNSVIICDRGNRRIVRWSRNEGTTEGEILLDNIGCWGIALDNQRNLYVSDIENHEVRRYQMGDPNGIVVAGGNGQGIGLDQLYQPTYISVTPQQTLYVSDTLNQRIMKWNSDATEGTIIGRGFPRGLVVDASENIYVADYGNHRVMRWPKEATEGTIIASGDREKEEEENQLYYPWGLTLDQNGHIYVADHLNHRIQRFCTE